jgi:general stress protein CsbA
MSNVLPKISNTIVGKILAFIVASSLLNYTGMFIVVLTWSEAVKCYRNMDFIGSILMFSLLIASTVIKPKMFKSKEKHTES